MSDPHVHITFTAPDISQLTPLFPGYEIVNLIATGGMGAVYRAVQKSLDRTVAIKILPQEFSKDAAFCAGFEAEAKAMARLNHPNLIGVYDFGEVEGMLYIIMEYVPGKSLFHSAHGIAIDPTEVIRLITGVSNGLAHAHENGIIHRDIKPSNILLDLNAQPKIGDFGLARPVENKVQEGEEIFGTPHYTAPEVVNSPHSVGHRADIFSVGVLLHELLTGRLPAEDRRPASVIIGCDPRFDAIIRRATNPIPEGRYASTADIAKDLLAISSSAGPRLLRSPAPVSPMRKGVPVPSVKSPSNQPPIRPGRSTAAPQSNPPSGLVGIVSLLVLIAVVWIIHSCVSNKQTTQSVAPTENTPANPPPVTPADIREAMKPNPKPKPEPKHESVPVPTPEPMPAPKPEFPPKPDKNPDPNAGVGTKPQPAPNIPSFDSADFIARNQKIVQAQATLLVAKHTKDLKNNFWDFEKSGQFVIRRLPKGRAFSENRFNATVGNWKNTSGLIQKILDEELTIIPGISACHTEYLEKQTSIDRAFDKDLSQLAAAYVRKLESQLEPLKAAHDTPAIALLQEEIDKARDEKQYFAPLLPAPPPSPGDSKMKDPNKETMDPSDGDS